MTPVQNEPTSQSYIRTVYEQPTTNTTSQYYITKIHDPGAKGTNISIIDKKQFMSNLQQQKTTSQY